MEKINIAELLKDCPKGMELDCTMYNKVTLLNVDDREGTIFPIKVIREDGASITLTKYGQHTDANFAKCVIFPKDKTTWEGFVPPHQFKDGDILTTIIGSIFIYKKIDVYNYCGSYASLDIHNGFLSTYCSYLKDCCHLATEEEKQKLFQAIKDNGYHWNAETKTLEKLSKFKVGDRIKYIYFDRKVAKVVKIHDKRYELDNGKFLEFQDENAYEISYDKFDITTLKPFDKVLVRDFDNETWEICFFSRLLGGRYFKCLDLSYVQCIPYEANKELHGTANDCDDFYKTWEK